MSVMTQPLPATGVAGLFTRADLEAMPDDGHRYEIIDGILIVSAAPAWKHQRAVTRLITILDHAIPDESFELLPGPFDVVFGDDTVVEPDLLIARYDDMEERGLEKAPPLLAVEVLSPSTRRFDLMLKWSRYEAAGTSSYWVVDPDVPSLTAWELREGRYVEVAAVTGDETFHAEIPYPVDITPSTLIRRERV